MLAIDNELNKPEGHADMEFVRTAHAILREMNKSTIVVSDESLEASLQSAKRKLANARKHRNIVRMAGRAVLATAAIFVVMVIADGVFHWEWLGSQSTDDQQQYVVTGQVVDPGIIEKGNADNSAIPPTEITTTDLVEAIAVLGFTPPMPAWFPEGWNVESYYSYLGSHFQIFSIKLRSQDSDGSLNYEIKHFLNIADAIATFEQNELGISTLINDWQVYFSQNIERNAAIWYENNICYSLYGLTTENDLTRIIQSINKGVT